MAQTKTKLMRGPEFGTKKEKEQFVGYSHNFERYIEVNGQIVDRLDQSLKFGILSPKEAQRLGIPFKRGNVRYKGFKDPDNVIFLFPLKRLNVVPRWPNAVSVVFDHSLEVLSWEEMQEYQEGLWPHASFTHGEVYMIRSIDPSYIKSIILPNPSEEELQNVKELVRKHVPDFADKIEVRQL